MKILILLPMLAALLCGCTNTSEMTFSPANTKVATIFWNSDAAQVIEIGSVDNPYSGIPAIKIKVDDAILFDSLACSPSTVSNYISQNYNLKADHFRGFCAHPGSRSLRSEKTWGEGARYVGLLKPENRKTGLTYDEARRQEVGVIVLNDKIQAIRIVDLRPDPRGNTIQIKIGDSPWTDSRLSRKQCVILFGKPIGENSYFTQ